ncbi:AzlD family protein [Methylobacterium sp. ID0610]|uniref:AzlD family protein n=1 Tax=Methylobacterium carpenticola TaxID=3344827 RepID=UPI00369A93AF
MIRDLLAGPAGSALAILALAVVTYLCRASGVVAMSRVRLTPRVERALRALPGSIVVATAVPTGLAAGLPGIAGLVTATAVMALTRFELAAIAAGLAVVAAGRALGL